jgi:hypothetical protein
MNEDSFEAHSLSEQMSLFPTPPRLVPRFIRMRDAPSYFGMDKNRFNRDVRPTLAAIPIGMIEVKAIPWADDYKSRNGHPAAQPEREKLYGKPKNVGSHQTSWDLAYR